MNIRLLILLSSIYAATDANLPLGTRCLLRDESIGICTKITDCESVMEQVRAKTVKLNPPLVCSQNDRSVCCPMQSGSKASTSTTTTARPMRISEKKCKEYGKYVFETVMFPSVVFGEPPVRKELDKCLHKAVPLIVGGVDAGIGEFPHQALLGYNEGSPSEWGCGGSLISRKFILTAAHCLYPRGHGAVKFVKLGLNNRLQNDSQVLLFNVAEIYQHPGYNTKTLSNDIGLLRLDRDVPLSERILPVCLPSKLYNAERAQASGFGRTGFQQAASENLLKVTLERFTRDECQMKFNNQITVTNDTMMCYGHHTENKDSCSGDSGGPLQLFNDDVYCTYTIVGVVSFGLKKCGTAGYPGVYANVFHYLDWIENIVWSGEAWQ